MKTKQWCNGRGLQDILLSLLKNYETQDIFNEYETGLFLTVFQTILETKPSSSSEEEEEGFFRRRRRQ